MTAWGALAGAGIATGALLVVSGASARPLPSAADRIAPYLDGPSVVARDDLGTPLDATTLERILGPSVRGLARRLQSLLGGSDALRRRLVAAGDDDDIDAYRTTQVLGAAAALAAAALVEVLLAASGRPVAPLPGVVLAILFALTGILGCDRRLSRRIERRREAVRVGLPAVADLLALAVGSGESPGAALQRVARVAHGPLADECRRACADTASGVPFVDALDALATRLDVASVRRFVDGIAVAVQRGTPMADVLRAQAGDARADVHRALLETAGRKELLMLVPVVFLVLPTVVLVALYPALSSLSSIAP